VQHNLIKKRGSGHSVLPSIKKHCSCLWRCDNNPAELNLCSSTSRASSFIKMELKKSTLDTEEKAMRKQAKLMREGKHQFVQYKKCNTAKDVNKLWKVWSRPVLDQRQLHTLNP
jgi:hypothetical protein